MAELTGGLDGVVTELLTRATALAQGGQRAEALPLLQRAASLAPDNAAIRHDLGFVLLQCGRLAECVIAFEAALAVSPEFALARLRLGVALQGLGNDDAALAAYQRASAQRPDLAEAAYRAGAMLDSRGRQADAIAAFRSAAAARPEASIGRLALARALLGEHQDAPAERVLRRLLELEPGHIVATDLLGTVHAEAGRLDDARACYERATAASPHMAGSYYELVRCARVTEADTGLVARMRAALDTPGLHAEARLKIHLALGKAADDLNDPAGAMRHFDEADRIRAPLCPFDPAVLERRVDRMIERITAERVAAAAVSGRDDATPVLIVGLPRSGTTLVEQILSCHGRVQAGGELRFWADRGAAWEAADGDGAPPSFIGDAGGDYGRLLAALDPEALRVTDKMPLNLFWAGFIHLCLPRATIIHCRRRPIDTALSIHRTFFNQHVALPTGGAALVRMVRAFERLAAHWRAVLPAERFVDLEYERLVGDPAPVIRRLVAACGVDWDEACLAPERNRRVVKTPSKWQVRQPIRPASGEAWRRFAPWLGELAALRPGLCLHGLEPTSAEDNRALPR